MCMRETCTPHAFIRFVLLSFVMCCCVQYELNKRFVQSLLQHIQHSIFNSEKNYLLNRSAAHTEEEEMNSKGKKSTIYCYLT